MTADRFSVGNICTCGDKVKSACRLQAASLPAVRHPRIPCRGPWAESSAWTWHRSAIGAPHTAGFVPARGCRKGHDSVILNAVTLAPRSSPWRLWRVDARQGERRRSPSRQATSAIAGAPPGGLFAKPILPEELQLSQLCALPPGNDVLAHHIGGCRITGPRRIWAPSCTVCGLFMGW